MTTHLLSLIQEEIFRTLGKQTFRKHIAPYGSGICQPTIHFTRRRSRAAITVDHVNSQEQPEPWVLFMTESTSCSRVTQLPLEGEGCAAFIRNIELGTMGGIWQRQWVRMISCNFYSYCVVPQEHAVSTCLGFAYLIDV